MPEDCIFCQIVDGEIPARTVYEDETTIAFLDANPLAPGHTVVIPKAHHERIGDLPDEVATDVFAAIHRVLPAVAAAVDADGTNVGFNDGAAAGQEIPHVHGHVIPRFEGDGGGSIHSLARSRADLSDEELDDIAADVSAEL